MINSHFEHHFDKVLSRLDIPSECIQSAMKYSLFPGGKRLRPLLVYLCGELLGVPIGVCDTIAAAVEIIHSYSLVHDDLPAMDNDDLRRGKPSCHRAYDQATAILVGDALQAWAIELLLTDLPLDLTPTAVITITKELVQACGPSGMVSGQSLDLTELSNGISSEESIRRIHQLKTGRLILACINMVIYATQVTEEKKSALHLFATQFGLAFQMQDDYFDSYDMQDILKKGRSSDKANKKSTYASLYSQQQLAKKIQKTYQSALNALRIFGDQANNLISFVDSFSCKIDRIIES